MHKEIPYGTGKKMILNSSLIDMYYNIDFLTCWQAPCLLKTILNYLVVFTIYLGKTMKKAACESIFTY